MAGLPKIVLARLKANPGDPNSPGHSAPGAEITGDHHLDANLLAAFAENTLSKGERSQVLLHLAACAECREVTAFAPPGEAAAVESVQVKAGRRWNPWLILRWGAMAAVLGALTIVVALRPGIWRGHQEIANKMPPPVPAAGTTNASPPPVSIGPLATPAPAPPPARARLERQEASPDFGTMKESSGASANMPSADKMTRAQARQQVTVMASTRPPTTLKAASVPPVKAEQEEAAGGALAASAPAPPPTAMASDNSMALAAAGKPAPVAQPAEIAAHSTTQGVEVTATNPSVGSGGSAAASPAPQPAAQTSYRGAARGIAGGMMMSRRESKSAFGTPTALWSVTPDGKVQRSTDGGKTLEVISVAPAIKFRAITALGNEVWAGGVGGALFHSSDGGAKWSRVALIADDNIIKDDIAAIQMRDAQHLTVTSASGAQWATPDAGQHWQKQP